MNLALVARLLSGFTLFYSLALLAPLTVALAEGPHPHTPHIDPTHGFLAGCGAGVLAAALLWGASRSRDRTFFRKEALAVVGLAWVVAAMIGAIPFQWSGAIPDGQSAIFETVSGLTTTGATVFGSADYACVEDLPRSLLLWRAMTQWIGGLGIILVFVTLLPAMGVTGKSLLQSEQIGLSSEGFQPRMLDQARMLLIVYLVLTTACGVLLWLVGIPSFDALCHAMTALATGGFSTRNTSVAAFASPAAEMVLTLFMFLAGCNFLVLANTARHGARSPATMLRDPEFRLYLGITLLVVTIVGVRLWHQGMGLADSARLAAFNVVSVFTSTGYATEDYQRWPLLCIVLLFTCMIVGACAGSTAGGLKTIRFLVACKLVAYTVRHYVRPKSVERIKVGNTAVPAAAIGGIMALVVLWFVGILAGGIVLAFDERIPFLTALATSTSLLGCCGPSICQLADGQVLGPDFGPMGGYGELGGAAKLFLSWLMLLGRLEFLAPLALLMPGFWRR